MASRSIPTTARSSRNLATRDNRWNREWSKCILFHHKQHSWWVWKARAWGCTQCIFLHTQQPIMSVQLPLPYPNSQSLHTLNHNSDSQRRTLTCEARVSLFMSLMASGVTGMMVTASVSGNITEFTVRKSGLNSRRLHIISLGIIGTLIKE